MTTKLHDALINEIAFVFDVLEHEDIESLYTIDTLSEAADQSEGYASAWGDELPEGLTDPETMMMVWNYCIEELRKAAEQKKIQQQDDQIAAMNPDCLRFRNAYEDGSSAFFDPDQLIHDLQRTGYDEIHREIIAKAMMAYHKSYQDNL